MPPGRSRHRGRSSVPSSGSVSLTAGWSHSVFYGRKTATHDAAGPRPRRPFVIRRRCASSWRGTAGARWASRASTPPPCWSRAVRGIVWKRAGGRWSRLGWDSGVGGARVVVAQHSHGPGQFCRGCASRPPTAGAGRPRSQRSGNGGTRRGPGRPAGPKGGCHGTRAGEGREHSGQRSAYSDSLITRRTLHTPWAYRLGLPRFPPDGKPGSRVGDSCPPGGKHPGSLFCAGQGPCFMARCSKHGRSGRMAGRTTATA